jgi:hypothetical protein
MVAPWSNRDVSGPEKLLALAKTILRRKVAHLAEQMGRQQCPDAVPGGEGSRPGLFQALRSQETSPPETVEPYDALDHVGRQPNDRERHLLRLLDQGHSRTGIAEELDEVLHAFRAYWGRVTERLRHRGARSARLTPTVACAADRLVPLSIPPRGFFVARTSPGCMRTVAISCDFVIAAARGAEGKVARAGVTRTFIRLPRCVCAFVAKVLQEHEEWQDLESPERLPMREALHEAGIPGPDEDAGTWW